MAKVYRQASEEMQGKVNDYFERFQKKDETWRRWVADGTKTQAEYKAWRTGQIAVGQRWTSMRDVLAREFADVNRAVRRMVADKTPEIYAENFNYGTYQLEHESGLDTSFNLYNREAVYRILRENPDLLPDPSEGTMARILRGKDIMYNRRALQSAVMQGIIQGESIPKIAGRLVRDVGEKNYKSAVRNARTLATGAQNAGRMDAYRRGARLGIETAKRWSATHDGRTRHWHSELDGEEVPLESPFENEYGEIMYPGDPGAEPANVYNCRCTLIPVYKGYEEFQSHPAYQDLVIEGQSYDEWKHDRRARSEPIDKQTKMGNTIRGAWNKKYRGK